MFCSTVQSFIGELTQELERELKKEDELPGSEEQESALSALVDHACSIDTAFFGVMVVSAFLLVWYDRWSPHSCALLRPSSIGAGTSALRSFEKYDVLSEAVCCTTIILSSHACDQKMLGKDGTALLNEWSNSVQTMTTEGIIAQGRLVSKLHGVFEHLPPSALFQRSQVENGLRQMRYRQF